MGFLNIICMAHCALDLARDHAIEISIIIIIPYFQNTLASWALTCLLSTLRRPGVRPVSVFCVATGISNRSLTGGISPLAMARK